MLTNNYPILNRVQQVWLYTVILTSNSSAIFQYRILSNHSRYTFDPIVNWYHPILNKVQQQAMLYTVRAPGSAIVQIQDPFKSPVTLQTMCMNGCYGFSWWFLWGFSWWFLRRKISYVVLPSYESNNSKPSTPDSDGKFRCYFLVYAMQDSPYCTYSVYRSEMHSGFNRDQKTNHNAKVTIKHLQCSASLPTFFPKHKTFFPLLFHRTIITPKQ